MNLSLTPKRAYFVMLGIIGIFALGLGASIYFGDQLLSKQAAKLTNLKLDNALLDQQQAALVKANKDVQQYSQLGDLARTIVPQDKDQAKTIREILSIASQSDVPLTAISFPASTLGAPKVVTVAPVAGSTATTPTTPVAPSVTQVKPVAGIKGLYVMEIIVQSDATDPKPYANLQNFLAKLEQNRRTAQVSQLVITPYPKDISLLSFSLTIDVFVRP
jgi:hypothetical protein